MASQGTLAPVPGQQFCDSNGDPLPGALIDFYLSGTSTRLAAYADAALSTPLSNPAVADAGGFLVYYLAPAAYKVVVKSAAGVVQRTVDPVSATALFNVDLDIEAQAGEVIPSVSVVYLSTGDGGRTPGKWYLADADLEYASTTAKALGFVSASLTANQWGSVRLAGHVPHPGGLTAGSTYYVSATAGGITTTPPANARPIAVASLSTELIMSHWLPGPNASLTVPGIVTIGDQTFEGVKTFAKTPLYVPMGAAGSVGRLGGSIHQNTTNVGNVGTGEDNLMTFSLQPLVLLNAGQALRIVAWGKTAANANNKRVRLYFGATVIVDTGNVAANNVAWRAEGYVVRTGAATQKANGWAMLTNIFISAAGVAPAETMSGAVTIKVTGEATTTDDVIQEAFFVETVG